MLYYSFYVLVIQLPLILGELICPWANSLKKIKVIDISLKRKKKQCLKISSQLKNFQIFTNLFYLNKKNILKYLKKKVCNSAPPSIKSLESVKSTANSIKWLSMIFSNALCVIMFFIFFSLN